MRRADAALISVTQTSLRNPWLYFHLGLLHRCVRRKGPVIPVFLDLVPENVSPTPLHLFQATRVVREEILALTREIAGRMPAPIEDRQLRARFDKHWEAFYQQSRRVPGPGTQQLWITLAFPGRNVTFQSGTGEEDADWHESARTLFTALSGSFGLPEFDYASLYHLDVLAGRWMEPPAIFSRLGTTHVGLVHPAVVEKWHGDASRLAASIRESRKPTAQADSWGREQA